MLELIWLAIKIMIAFSIAGVLIQIIIAILAFAVELISDFFKGGE